jgi:hypothetical protein
MFKFTCNVIRRGAADYTPAELNIRTQQSLRIQYRN